MGSFIWNLNDEWCCRAAREKWRRGKYVPDGIVIVVVVFCRDGDSQHIKSGALSPLLPTRTVLNLMNCYDCTGLFEIVGSAARHAPLFNLKRTQFGVQQFRIKNKHKNWMSKSNENKYSTENVRGGGGDGGGRRGRKQWKRENEWKATHCDECFEQEKLYCFSTSAT